MFAVSDITNIFNSQSFGDLSSGSFLHSLGGNVNSSLGAIGLGIAALFGFRFFGPIVFPLISTVSFVLATISRTACYLVKTVVHIIGEFSKTLIGRLAAPVLGFARSPLLVTVSVFVVAFLIGCVVHSSLYKDSLSSLSGRFSKTMVASHPSELAAERF